MKLLLKNISFLFILVTCVNGLWAKADSIEHYTIDTTHSNITFKVRHFLTNVTGSFEHFDGEIWLNRDDISKSYFEARVYPTSIDTNNDDRDAELQSKHFFDVKKHPTITIKSTEWKVARTSKREFIINAELTMCGETHPITLYTKLIGFGHNNKGAYLSGWEVVTEFNRKTWGMTYGGPAIGNEISVEIEVEAIRKAH